MPPRLSLERELDPEGQRGSGIHSFSRLRSMRPPGHFLGRLLEEKGASWLTLAPRWIQIWIHLGSLTNRIHAWIHYIGSILEPFIWIHLGPILFGSTLGSLQNRIHPWIHYIGSILEPLYLDPPGSHYIWIHLGSILIWIHLGSIFIWIHLGPILFGSNPGST